VNSRKSCSQGCGDPFSQRGSRRFEFAHLHQTIPSSEAIRGFRGALAKRFGRARARKMRTFAAVRRPLVLSAWNVEVGGSSPLTSTHLTSARWTETATAPEWPRPRIGGWVRPWRGRWSDGSRSRRVGGLGPEATAARRGRPAAHGSGRNGRFLRWSPAPSGWPFKRPLLPLAPRPAR
jgi:hypothetical protein